MDRPDWFALGAVITGQALAPRRLSSVPLHELEDEIRALEDEDLEAALAQHRMERLP